MQSAAAQALKSPADAGSIWADRQTSPRRKSGHARQMIDSGEQSVSGMAKIIGVHRVTLHKALKKRAAR